MRKIVLFNPKSSSKDTLNIFAKLARKGKRVLVIDLRHSFDKQSSSEVGLDITAGLDSPQFFKTVIKPLEMNLDVVEGSSRLNTTEFRVFNSLFKFDVFEQQLADLSYDFVVFELSYILDLFTLNGLFASNEVMIYHELKTDAAYDIMKFLSDFNALYSHKILCSLIIATYSNTLNKQDYTALVSDFSSKMISFPFKQDKNSSQYKECIENISNQIEELEEIFDPKDNYNWALEKQQEYEEILHRISQ